MARNGEHSRIVILIDLRLSFLELISSLPPFAFFLGSASMLRATTRGSPVN